MPDKKITIVWRNGSPEFNPPPGRTELKFGDVVTLELTGATGGASIDEVTIFANRQSGGQDQKGNTLCGWSRSRPNTCGMYTIAAVSDTVVTITDNERPTHDKKYWFSVSGTQPDWSLDPELINRPDGGG